MSTTAKHRAPRRSHSLRRPVVVAGCALAIAASSQVPAFGDTTPEASRDIVPGFSVTLPEPVARVVPPELVRSVDALLPPPPPAPPVVSATPAATPAQPQPVALPPEDDQVQIGHLRMHRPSVVSPEAADQISSGAGEMVQGVSDVLASSGVDPDRADRVGEQVVGNAAVGGVIGAAVAAPVATAVGAVVGGGLGLLFGIPFLPTGLVVGPLVGTALVTSLVALPAVATGVVVGAAVGYVNGMSAP